MKALLVDEREAVLASAAVPIATRHPASLAAEQEPTDWWAATAAALDRLRQAEPRGMAAVGAIGLSGQMHSLVLLDAADRPLRPAMLWNDGRAHREALALRNHGPALAMALGVPAHASFTSAKLRWLQRNEPELLARAHTLLLPKDLLRLHLTGERVTDVSDAAGTWLLDQACRIWSATAIEAVGCDPTILPPIVESTAVSGTVRPDLARRFGLPDGVVVAGGAGDTPAGAVGIGAVEPGRGFASLGTSAQLFVSAPGYRPAPERFLHAFCHALPQRWYQMAAMLNGASVLTALSRLVGGAGVTSLAAEAEASFTGPSGLLYLPYIAGERTPHDNPHASGVVFGLTPATSRAELVLAAMEGVAFTFADAIDLLRATGTTPGAISLIGGGARSRLWARLLAAAMDLPLQLHAEGETGPAFGAVRLARLAHLGDAASASLAPPPISGVILPEARLVDAYRPRVAAFRELYQALRPSFEKALPSHAQPPGN